MVTIKTANTKYPTYEIDLSKLVHFTDIIDIMKNIGIREYVYSFHFNNEVIKYGFSTDKKSWPGERLYRQAGHLYGWSSRLTSKSGSDMISIDNEYYKKNKINLNRNNMTITVIDLTGIKNDNLNDPDWPCKKLERELIAEYVQSNGHTPIGNLRDESLRNNSYISRNIYFNLFNNV